MHEFAGNRNAVEATWWSILGGPADQHRNCKAKGIVAYKREIYNFFGGMKEN